MNRIAARFDRLRKKNRGALITFLEAWDPDPATSMALLRGMPVAGADLIEIGCPFTDPMADGPTIQLAAKRALAAGGSMMNMEILSPGIGLGDCRRRREESRRGARVHAPRGRYLAEGGVR